MILHFVLKVQQLRFVWHVLQDAGGMRPVVMDEAMQKAMLGGRD